MKNRIEKNKRINPQGATITANISERKKKRNKYEEITKE